MSHKDVYNRLRDAVTHKQNVLIEGPHGTGKTQMVKELFDEKFGDGNWAYFNGPTMDPYIDFIGCPREGEDENGVKFLDILRPKRFAEDRIKAIFIDEFNRTEKPVRNAMMEIVQMRSLNGVKYPNLEIVWGAINPSGDEYIDVEELDPAQLDRFDMLVTMPTMPDKVYFAKRYGDKAAGGAIQWWKELDKETKKKVSPRRLDKTLDCVLNKGMPASYFLSGGADPSKLTKMIASNPAVDGLVKCKSPNTIRKFLSDPNNLQGCSEFILERKNADKYLPFAPAHFIATAFIKNNPGPVIQSIVGSTTLKPEDAVDFYNTVIDIYDQGTNTELVEKLGESGTITLIRDLRDQAEASKKSKKKGK